MITKTDYKEGMKCRKKLWMKKNHPGVFSERGTTKSEKEGICVGAIAGGLFEDVVKIPRLPDLNERARLTEIAIREGHKTIAEAAFLSGDLYCAVDYLEVEGDEVIINEVKATNSVRKTRRKDGVCCEGKLKDEYREDACFQFHVLSVAGKKVKQVNLIHLNGEYRRFGELELDKLFVIEDVTEEIKPFCIGARPPVAANIAVLKKYIADADGSEDLLSTRCIRSGEECELWDRCSAGLPRPNVFDLNGSFTRKRDAFYKEGLVSFEDLLKSGKLNEKAQIQVEAELKENQTADRNAIKEFLEAKIRYPLCFLDFETFQTAIPLYDGQRPYQQVPFQYSLDIIERPGAEIIHREFLGKEGEDPRREIAQSLVRDIPRDACVTAYNMKFEEDRLKELADLFPDLQEYLRSIAKHLEDFIIPFNNYWLYNRQMKGKSSIKYVLPALFPGDEMLNYHNLPGVQKGDQAMEMFLKLPDLDEQERKRQRAYMLRYCRLDTFAMIKVYEALLLAAGDRLYEKVAAATEKYARQMWKKDEEEDSRLLM